ncbi:hypothetical protein G5B31_10940 [Rhodobacter sp. SGA-6-6]|uniref:hypothetical protein n=1 Tax=Rhodobacter sp. SGA-6-6 TaxID=2710882 RepID=UPI0013EDA06F|nr:hypothetical protein [Rhodobacter sp. SGA-6-6]NGM46055.1 hypothetical protein [Rhodobacter sp. SGA-6-6]
MTTKPIPPHIRPDGLQLEENRGFQQRFWRLQRGAWLGFALLMILALLGFTGSGGPFQKQRIGFTDAVVELPRVLRWEAGDEMVITFDAPARTRSLRIGQSFADLIAIERIEPEPAAARLVSGGQVLDFAAGGDAPHRVRLALRPLHFGWLRFDLGIGGESRSVGLLVLP